MRSLIWRMLSLVLAAALILGAAAPAGAEEGATEPVTETTAPPETSAPTQPPETTLPELPPETSAPTQPPETTAPSRPEEPSEPAAVPETSAPTVPTETSEPTGLWEETEFSETTEPTRPQNTIPARTSLPTVITIAEAKTMAGTADITIQGSVVYLNGTQAVLQDDTGGIRLAFGEAPANITPGDVVMVTGDYGSAFSVTKYLWLHREEMPAVTATLETAEENIRIKVTNATVSSRIIKQGRRGLELVAAFPEDVQPGDTVTAYGVILDGCFYADTLLPYAVEEGQTEDWNLYFGLLHAHTGLSDGVVPVADAFAEAAAVEGLDFFAVTDHSNSFDNTLEGSINTNGTDISEAWAAGKDAAAKVTDGNFVGIFGYEMTWGEDAKIGHINTFNTMGWQSREQPGFETLTGYCEALVTAPNSISQFNHPDNMSYGDFDRFSNYSPEYDEVICLLEVGGENGKRYYDSYTKALDKGWHVAPTSSHNNHHGNFGTESAARTVAVAKELTEDSLYDAMANYRVYATDDSDLSILYKLNGQIMGSILGPADTLTVSAALSDPTDSTIGTVEAIADGGESIASQVVNTPETEISIAVPKGYSYYYLRITQPDGDIAVTAPVWVDEFENMGIRSFSADTDQPRQGQKVQLKLELFNQEKTDFLLEKIEISHNETVIQTVEDPGTVAAMGTFSHSASFTWPDPGEVQLTAVVTGTVAGADREYKETLTLRFQAAQETAADIADVRAGQAGLAYRVAGYITAGNANPYNTFPNTLYLQDDTGGIAVTGYAGDHIQVGTYMEAGGVLRHQGGNLVLELTDCAFPEKEMYRYVPRTMTHAVAMNYSVHGGELLQIEGEVVSLTRTADGKGISRMTLKDIVGDLATVMIEDFIGSGAYGTNELAKDIQVGRTVRAMGLLHVDEYGATVLRVRNCEEVVYVPPVADITNPKTGDVLFG